MINDKLYITIKTHAKKNILSAFRFFDTFLNLMKVDVKTKRMSSNFPIFKQKSNRIANGLKMFLQIFKKITSKGYRGLEKMSLQLFRNMSKSTSVIKFVKKIHPILNLFFKLTTVSAIFTVIRWNVINFVANIFYIKQMRKIDQGSMSNIRLRIYLPVYIE